MPMYSLHSIKTLETRRIKRFPAKTFTNVGMVQRVIKNRVREPTHHTGNKSPDTRRGSLASLAIHNPCRSRFIAFKRLCIHCTQVNILRLQIVTCRGCGLPDWQGTPTYSIFNDSLHHPYICECFCRKPFYSPSIVDSRLLVYATPVVVGGRLRGYAWCGMQLSIPQFRGVLHKPPIGIVPDPFLVKAVWLRETTLHIRSRQPSRLGLEKKQPYPRTRCFVTAITHFPSHVNSQT